MSAACQMHERDRARSVLASPRPRPTIESLYSCNCIQSFHPECALRELASLLITEGTMRPPKLSACEDLCLEMKISRIATELKNAGANFFQKVMSRTMVTEIVNGSLAYSLEFPQKFWREHAESFMSGELNFRRLKGDRSWPISLRVQEIKYSERKRYVRLFAYGDGGWKDFVTDNRIQVGDVVFFSLLRKSHFLVNIARRPPQSNDDPNNSPSKTDGPCGFVAIVSPEEALSLEFPARFWQRHRHMLKGAELRLQGPEAAMMVKLVKICHIDAEGWKNSMRLESGWKEFFVANMLQVGDSLQFSLLEPLFFKVDLPSRSRKLYEP